MNSLHLDHYRCLLEVATLCTAGYGVLAIWVALGRGSWFVRAMIAVLAVAILLPIRAYQPALLLIVGMSLTTWLLALVRYRSEKWQASRSCDRPLSRKSPRRILTLAVLVGCIVVIVVWNKTSSPSVGWYDRLLVLSFIGPASVVIVNSLGQRLLDGRLTVSEKPLANSAPMRFDLRKMLLVVVIIAAICGIATKSLRESLILDWQGFLISAACFVAITCSACCITMARRWYGRCFSLLILIVSLVATPYVHVWWSTDWLEISSLYWTNTQADMILAMRLFSVTVALIIVAAVFILRAALWIRTIEETSDHLGLSTITARLATLSVFLGVYSSLTPLYFQMIRPLERPDSVVGNDNDYARLIDEMMRLQEINGRERTVSELHDLGLTETANEVNKGYQILDDLVEKPFRVPLDFDQNNRGEYFGSILAEVQAFRALARTWDKESDQAIQAKRFDQASDRSLSNVRLGSRLSVGGLMVHALVGVAVEVIGQHGLSKTRETVSIEQAAELLRHLALIDSQRESVSTFTIRENAWADRTDTWRFRLALHGPPYMTGRHQQGSESTAMISPSLDAFSDAMRRRDVVHRLLMVELALRLYLDKYAKYPRELSQLVPEFLSIVPPDPYGGDPLIYRPADDGYVLYSISWDGDDDGGKFGTLSQMYGESFDFDLDTPWRQSPPTPK